MPYARNSRTHSDEQISQIASSIKAFGFTNPILVSDGNDIIAGHGRALAAGKLGLDHVPCIRLGHLTERDRRAYVIADNRLAMNADWDTKMLELEVAELQAMDFDLDLLGFEEAELDALLCPEVLPEEGLTDPDAVPENVDTRCKPGDLWILGNHRLLCGDSTDVLNVERLMGGEQADMVFTDPPYNTGMKENSGSTRLSHMFNDDFTDDEWQALLSGMCASYLLATKPDAVLYVCLDWRRSHELVPHLKQHFKFSNLIVWDKVVHGLGSDYKYTHEFIHVCKRGAPAMETHQGDREYQDVWRIQRKMGRDEDHATKKPTELVERALRHSTRPSSLVADLFLGSGSTLIACEKTGRRCFGMELDPRYCDTILTRWENFTGKTAHLEEPDGQE